MRRARLNHTPKRLRVKAEDFAPTALPPADRFPLTLELIGQGVSSSLPYLSAIVIDLSVDGRNVEIRTTGRVEGSNRHDSIPRDQVQDIRISVRPKA